MRFKCSPSRHTDKDVVKDILVTHLRNWHSWFAWYPVSVESGVCVWWERVERRFPKIWVGQCSGKTYREAAQYRLPETHAERDSP